MIKSLFFKLTQVILIIALVYAGSFIFIEESAEKTEESEKSEEKLHRSYHSHIMMRLLVRQPEKPNKDHGAASERLDAHFLKRKVFSDYNVNYIYTISYLDQSFSS